MDDWQDPEYIKEQQKALEEFAKKQKALKAAAKKVKKKKTKKKKKGTLGPGMSLDVDNMSNAPSGFYTVQESQLDEESDGESRYEEGKLPEPSRANMSRTRALDIDRSSVDQFNSNYD